MKKVLITFSIIIPMLFGCDDEVPTKPVGNTKEICGAKVINVHRYLTDHPTVDVVMGESTASFKIRKKDAAIVQEGNLLKGKFDDNYWLFDIIISGKCEN